MSQEWLHPAVHHEFQAAFIDSQPNLFLESNGLLGHEHLTYGGYPCPGYELQNHRTPSNCINEENLQGEITGERETATANAKQSSVAIKQNERICVMLEANRTKIEKEVDA